VHGLFGSSGNWMGVAKRLQADYRLILPDLRNHGRSPHHPSMDFPAMAADLLALLDRLEIESASLVGHSMGGKASMWLALTQPERVARLVAADIAPVSYHNRFKTIFQGLKALPLEQVPGRGAADRMLSSWVPERAVRQYLLQNLVKRSGGWQWRLNLPVLEACIGTLTDFPARDGMSYAGEVLFLYGERSDYVLPEYRERILSLFPLARLRMLAQAGHWIYAEQLEAFSGAVKAFVK
jgi:pimeloyl-ACP methyl ester carboxylesterase